MLLGFFIATIFVLIGGLHLYWAAGGRWGSDVAIPETGGKKSFSPTPLATVAVALALFAAAIVVLGRIGFGANLLPQWISKFGVWCLCAVFFLRAIGDFKLVGVFKRIRNTRFAYFDTRLFTPLCFALAFGLLILTQSK